MSANNQTLVKEHKGKWYVFPNVMAESWDEVSRIDLGKRRHKVFNTRAEALVYAHNTDNEEWSEYGVHEYLAKDGADVEIVDD